MKRYGLAGFGLILTDDDNITGIDLDDCVTDSGSLSDVAAEIIGYDETYAETSPSGNGIRLLARGKIDKALKDDKEGVEVYGTGRYLTIWHSN
jgi:primase-polymerase (primpol)-like protein